MAVRKTETTRPNTKGNLAFIEKLHSKMNARKHGLQAESLVISLEEIPAFNQLKAAFFERFQPVDLIEVAVVDQMVAAKWRLDRALSIETTLLLV